MTFLSYGFAGFLPLALLCFYGCPRKWRPGILFLASALFLFLSGGAKSLGVYGASAAAVWAAALGIGRFKETKRLAAGMLFWGGAGVLLMLLAGFQYINFPGYTLEEYFWLTGREYQWEPVQTAAPAAISFYTLSLLGYLTEVWWGSLPPEKNFAKLALFGGFFPQMAMGPIARYDALSRTLFSGSGAGLESFLGSLQRLLWGFFQKWVISERLAVLVNTVYGDYETYSGWYLVLAAVAFAFQLYTDFAGAMDIALGTAGLFGVRLEENFRQPFYSRSIAEFWRRWHMTLGAWFKDFVMYPLLKTETFQRMGDWGKRRFGKKQGKKIPTAAALFAVWFLLGLWHGGKWTFIIGSGLYHAGLMAAALLTEPLQKKFYSASGISRDHPLWIAMQRIRTFVLVAAGFVLFRSDSLKMAADIFKGMFTGNTGIFTSEGFFALGLSAPDSAILLFGLGLLWAVSFWKEHSEGKTCRLPARGAVCAALALGVLIFGFYGRGYDPSAFIYARF